MTTKYISVERLHVADNRVYKEERDGLGMPIEPEAMKPCIFIEFADGTDPITAHRVAILGPSEVVYRPHNFEPGDPNAHVWIETEAPVAFTGEFDGDLSEGGYIA